LTVRADSIILDNASVYGNDSEYLVILRCTRIWVYWLGIDEGIPSTARNIDKAAINTGA